MKLHSIDRLRALLNRADIAPHIQREVINAFTARSKDEPGARESVWRELLDRVRHVRRMVLTNKPKWAPAVVPLYQEYTDMLSVVITKLEQARIEVTPEGEPVTVTQFTAARALVNKRRAGEGKLPLAVCGYKWQDWVPAHIRRAFELKVATYYDSKGIIGARFTPFITRELKAENAMRIKRIDAAIKNLRRAMANCGTTPPLADNLLGAMYLSAARQAERGLVKYRGNTDVLENPCPVNWLHLLEPRMRARLRDVMAADKDGRVCDIPLDWCRDFYFAPQPGIEGEDPALIRDMEATRELAQEIETAGIDDEEHS